MSRSRRRQNNSQNDSHSSSPSSLPNEIRREILQGREFSLAEVIGREGGTFLRGNDSIPRPMRAIATLNHFLDTHLTDSEGALKPTLQRWLQEDARFSQNLDLPLMAMAETLEEMAQPPALYEFARQVNVHWEQMYGDRPYFQKPGQPPHPEAAYSHEGIQSTLKELQMQFWREIAIATWLWALLRSGPRSMRPHRYCQWLISERS